MLFYVAQRNIGCVGHAGSIPASSTLTVVAFESLQHGIAETGVIGSTPSVFSL
jgi:hypothetical protein